MTVSEHRSILDSVKKVCASIISYNQAAYIDSAVDGALSQKLNSTRFSYQIIIGDDASTDSTFAIAKETAGSFSNIHFLDNQVNHGMHRNWQRCIEACDGEYVALCEGDDYWHHSEKLQKQINLLEQNPDVAACFSNALVVDENGSESEFPYVDKNYDRLTAKEFFELNFNPIPTCTIVFRKSLLGQFPKEYYESPFADWILHTMLIQKGDYIFLPESTASYRRHNEGVWSGIKKEGQLLNKLKAIQLIHKIVDSSYRKQVRSAMRKQLDQLLYFYREEGERMKFFRTWVKLKFS